jgi:hypothetical protein
MDNQPETAGLRDSEKAKASHDSADRIDQSAGASPDKSHTSETTAANLLDFLSTSAQQNALQDSEAAKQQFVCSLPQGERWISDI